MNLSQFPMRQDWKMTFSPWALSTEQGYSGGLTLKNGDTWRLWTYFHKQVLQGRKLCRIFHPQWSGKSQVKRTLRCWQVAKLGARCWCCFWHKDKCNILVFAYPSSADRQAIWIVKSSNTLKIGRNMLMTRGWRWCCWWWPFQADVWSWTLVGRGSQLWGSSWKVDRILGEDEQDDEDGDEEELDNKLLKEIRRNLDKNSSMNEYQILFNRR